ncbi:hypothetical protein BpHYR1_032382 [Brachionus plicatilis]|uniref:Uncharacterized protein n=1 Tax=Brachionus plicatilis TaxID=10195 RepID=A0A3M7SGE4_BRAPC|nr:hypothetical protein BpHYR1_032382 [Brachionus plicatilis]
MFEVVKLESGQMVADKRQRVKLAHVGECVGLDRPNFAMVELDCFYVGANVVEGVAIETHNRAQNLQPLQTFVFEQVVRHCVKKVVRQVKFEHVDLAVGEQIAAQVAQLVVAEVDALQIGQLFERVLAHFTKPRVAPDHRLHNARVD